MAFSQEGFYLENGLMKDSSIHDEILQIPKEDLDEEALEAYQEAILLGLPEEDARILYLGEEQ